MVRTRDYRYYNPEYLELWKWLHGPDGKPLKPIRLGFGIRLEVALPFLEAIREEILQYMRDRDNKGESPKESGKEPLSKSDPVR